MGTRALPAQTEEVPPEEVRQAALNVMGYYQIPGGYTPGGFTTSLISTYELADASNRIRLAFAFPAIVGALGYVQRNDIEGLTKLASGRS